MVKTPVVISLAVWALSGTASAEYPAAYPFENESTEWTLPPASTPSLTFDDEDPGGYFYTYIVAKTEIEAGVAWENNGSHQYLFVVDWEIDPFYPSAHYNCTTGKDKHYFDENTYGFDTVNGQKYCDSPKECCAHLNGKVKYFGDGDMLEYDLPDAEESHEQGLCTESFHEGMFCSMFNDYAIVSCNEQIITDTDREIMSVCLDSILHYISHCPIFMSTKSISPGEEPLSYLENMTVDEFNGWNAVRNFPDKVCTPYSYFFPETGKDADAGKDDSENTDASGAAPASASASDASGAAAVVASFACLAMIL